MIAALDHIETNKSWTVWLEGFGRDKVSKRPQ
jgi:hypothetical protein